MQLHYAIVFVSDMKRSISFYRDLLEIPVRFESSHWTEFATEGATLALHLAEGPGSGAAAPSESAGWCRPGFRVPDIDVFHQRMIERQVVCVQPPRETFGVWVAQYLDPDGLAISISGVKQG